MAWGAAGSHALHWGSSTFSQHTHTRTHTHIHMHTQTHTEIRTSFPDKLKQSGRADADGPLGAQHLPLHPCSPTCSRNGIAAWLDGGESQAPTGQELCRGLLRSRDVQNWLSPPLGQWTDSEGSAAPLWVLQLLGVGVLGGEGDEVYGAWWGGQRVRPPPAWPRGEIQGCRWDGK